MNHFIPYHDAPGTKIDRPWVHNVYIDYCKAKSMFYMVTVVFFEGVMLSYDIIISHSQVIDKGPSALLFLY